jgi:hypothetical protein
MMALALGLTSSAPDHVPCACAQTLAVMQCIHAADSRLIYL